MGCNWMKLDDFIKVTHKEIDEFKLFWENGNIETPKYFPVQMAEGDWVEQFITWNQCK